VGSAAAELAAPFQPVSNASKAGLLAFSRSLNRQVSGTGVEVFTALPAYAYTDLLQPATERWARELGVTVDTPDFIAEQCISALLKGQHEVIFGGFPVRALMFLERHLPALATMVWRALLTPDAIAAHERE
jgi:short-subunit dehydrogenase